MEGYKLVHEILDEHFIMHFGGDKNVHEGYKHIISKHFKPKMVTFNKYDNVQ